MRLSVALIVVVGLFACSQAGLLDDFKNVATTIGSQIADKAKELASSFLGDLLSKFQLGKRAILADKFKEFFSKTKDFIDGAKQKGLDVFKGALTKLNGIVNKFHEKLGLLKSAEGAKKAVDDVVAEHNEKQKRVLAELWESGKSLLSSAIDKVKQLASGVKAKASELVSGLLQKGTDLLIGKRATLSDHLSTIGSALSSAVSPFKDIVAGLGNTLKGHFSNLVDTVKGHASALKDKLSGHVDDLKQHGSTLLEHGKNALKALSEVASDILGQTLTNAKSSIDGIAKTAADAGQTALNHFTGGSSTF